MIKYSFIITSLLFCDLVITQILDNQSNFQIEQVLEFISENDEGNLENYSMVIDELEEILINPINLNAAEFEQLNRLPFLTDIEIQHIIDYREQFGLFLSVYELNIIQGLSLEKIKLMLAFISIDPIDQEKEKIKEMLANGRIDIITRLSHDFGDLNKKHESDFLGDLNHLYFRYKYKYKYKNKFSYGFLGEKDPGEEFFRGSQKTGFDFYSGYIELKGKTKIKQLIIGDYHVNFGMGLTIWTGYNQRKSSQVLSIKSSRIGFRPNSSINESNYFRGAAIKFQHKKFSSSFFLSAKKIDANIIVLDEDKLEQVVNSIYTSGFHRTNSELIKKKQINQKVFGSVFGYQNSIVKFNLISVLTHFNYPFSLSESTYKKLNTNNQIQFSNGLSYHVLKNKISVFGEISLEQNFSINLINGIVWQPKPNVACSVILNKFNKRSSLFNLNFIGQTTNQTGVYIGLDYQVSAKTKFTTYYHQYKYNWLRFLVDGPSIGQDILIQINHKINSKSIFYLRFRNTLTEKNTLIETVSSKQQSETNKQSLRLNYLFKINSKLQLKSRIEGVCTIREKNELDVGVLIAQDIVYQFNNFPVKLYFRYAMFETDSYNERIYFYENDVYGKFYIPAYFGQGIRNYFMLKYDVYKSIDLWLKYSRTIKTNEIPISVNGQYNDVSSLQRLTIQFRIKF